MEADLHTTQVAFYLTGKQPAAHLDAVAGLGLTPALFSAYRDLTQLRYDFPLVLVKDRPDASFVEPLSGLIDAILEKIAHGKDAERIRKHVLHLESAIRSLSAGGTTGLLSTLWDQAARPLAAADKLVADSLALARTNLKVDGEVVDCNQGTPLRLLGHAWSITQAHRAKVFAKEINRLALKIADILKTDFVNSDAGKSAANLQSSFGSGPLDNFDFTAMSQLLTQAKPAAAAQLPPSRRQRLEQLLAVLNSQQFFPTAATAGTAPYSFVFDSCSAALDAYRARLPQAIELAKAIAVSELEIKGEYHEARHDVLFEAFGENGLDARDLALFPEYLVHVNAERMSSAEQEQLTEILSADMPMKILLQTDNIVEESPVGNGHLTYARLSRRLTNMAIGMNDVFVLQAPSSKLCRFRKHIQRGLDYYGPALFSVFSGASGAAGAFPAYLVAAAALESRVFPAYVYDPSAGLDWASRFSLDENPQAEQDWPLHELVYEGDNYQTQSERVPFTLIDFVACDTRYAKHFARVPREKWDGSLVSVVEPVALENRWHFDHVPSLLMVDAQNRLHKVIVNEKLVRAAHRCRSRWHSLQELGGIHDSRAERLLAHERKVWEERLRRKSAESAEVASAAAVAAAAEPAAEEHEPERSPDEAYIETGRCSTCNECTQINNKMFAYDSNQQAYIADISAGTYAQLVEAAESCQVSVIHPGKPRNPNEAGLKELLKRAEPFL